MMITYHSITKGPVKHALLVLLVLAPAGGSFAQERPLLQTSQRQPVQITTLALFQRYVEDEMTLSEMSFPVFVYVPVGRGVGLSLLASQATASGDTLETLSGLNDALVTLSYARRLGRSSLVVSVSANLPSGKQELTQDEFSTSIPLSLNFYDFRVSSFGQGLSLSPGLTFATPLSESFVLGLGASYLYKGSFKPLQGMEDRYEPGSEILLTGGMDIRLSQRAALSGDVTYTLYDTDRVGELEVYDSGSKTTATAVFRHHQGFNVLRLLVRYRGRAKSSVLSDTMLVTQTERTLPNQVEVRALYRLRLRPSVSTGLLVHGRFFEETAVFTKKQLLDVGLLPEVKLSNTLSVIGRFIYTLGTIDGFEAGGGLTLRL